MKLKTYSAHGDSVYQPTYHRAPLVTRQCISCGVLLAVDPSRPCAACGASYFHLIPPARELAEW